MTPTRPMEQSASLRTIRQKERNRLKRYLRSRSTEEIVDRLVSDVPWFFRRDPDAYEDWRQALAQDMPYSPSDVHIVGSAATGFSLNPEKPGRLFKEASHPRGPSDFDVAVVCSSLFVQAWELIVAYDRLGKLGFSIDIRALTRRGVYWGHINPRTIPLGTTPSRLFRAISAIGSRHPRTKGHPVRIRIYRQRGDLRGYQVNSLNGLRANLNL